MAAWLHAHCIRSTFHNRFACGALAASVLSTLALTAAGSVSLRGGRLSGIGTVAGTVNNTGGTLAVPLAAL